MKKRFGNKFERVLAGTKTAFGSGVGAVLYKAYCELVAQASGINVSRVAIFRFGSS